MAPQDIEPMQPLATHHPIRLIAAACVGGCVFMLGAVLSATGEDIAATQKETPAVPAVRSYATAFRADAVDIPLKSDGELEYKVRMKAGAILVYSWSVEGAENPEWFYSDFHGEVSPLAAGEKETVVEYEQKSGVEAKGALTAPFAGIHGWFLQNSNATGVIVHLKFSGFYELIPAGEDGNLDRIEARPMGVR